MNDISTADLKKAWDEIRRTQPAARERDAAAELGVSEAELIATRLGDGVIRLKPDWHELLRGLEGLGEVMALTRNDVFVHEKVGHYRNISMHPVHEMGQVLDKDVDLRIFFRHWHFGFAVTKETDEGLRRSLQFFDRSGTAVHKTHLRDESDVAHYEELVEKHRHSDQSPSVRVEAPPAAETSQADEDVDRSALLNDWRALKDTHDFIFLLRNHKVGRLQAFRLVGDEFAREVQTSSLRTVLESASAGQMPIMVFVGSRGCIQIHTGPVDRLKEGRGWYNILDPGFSLHVKEGLIDSAWVVRKPTDDGDVHSLEFFDAKGDVVCYLFGERKEERREREEWRALVGRLE